MSPAVKTLGCVRDSTRETTTTTTMTSRASFVIIVGTVVDRRRHRVIIFDIPPIAALARRHDGRVATSADDERERSCRRAFAGHDRASAAALVVE